MNDNDQSEFINQEGAEHAINLEIQNNAEGQDSMLDANMRKEMPKLPDELYLTALNDKGEERLKKNRADSQKHDPNEGGECIYRRLLNVSRATRQ